MKLIHRASKVVGADAASAEVSVGGQNYNRTIKPSVSKQPEPITPSNPNK